jgi:hypothetical protein
VKIRDTIKDWASLSWGGSFAGLDRIDLPNPGTTVIKNVIVLVDRIRIEAEADNRPVSDKRPVSVTVSPENAIFDRVVVALKSAIGKTLNDAGDINV